MLAAMVHYILPIIGILGGMILSIGTIINIPPWSRISIRIAGLCVIMWGILAVIQFNHIFMFNAVVSRLLASLRIFLGGMAIGMLLVVGIAGGFNKKSKN